VDHLEDDKCIVEEERLTVDDHQVGERFWDAAVPVPRVLHLGEVAAIMRDAPPFRGQILMLHTNPESFLQPSMSKKLFTMLKLQCAASSLS
jgi:hypothetical protein